MLVWAHATVTDAPSVSAFKTVIFVLFMISFVSFSLLCERELFYPSIVSSDRLVVLIADLLC